MDQQTNSYFDSWFLFLIAITSGLGFLVNFKYSMGVWTTYNLKKSIYLVLFLNTALTTICLCLTLSTSIKLYLENNVIHEIKGSILICAFLVDGIIVSFWCGAFFVSLISIFRYNFNGIQS